MKNILSFITIALLLVDVIIYCDLRKCYKLYENDLVENHIKGLIYRGVAMMVISILLAVIGIILQII